MATWRPPRLALMSEHPRATHLPRPTWPRARSTRSGRSSGRRSRTTKRADSPRTTGSTPSVARTSWRRRRDGSWPTVRWLPARSTSAEHRSRPAMSRPSRSSRGGRGQGYGTAVMREVGTVVDAAFELGALGTGEHHFYERLGWATLARAIIRPVARRRPSYAGRRRLHHGPRDADHADARPRRPDQLRVATRRRLVRAATVRTRA